MHHLFLALLKNRLHRFTLLSATVLVSLTATPLTVTNLGMKITSAQAQTTQKPDVKTLRFLENLGGLETFQNVLVNYKEIGNRQGQARTLTALAGLHYSLARYTKALKFYQQALAIHKQIGDREGVGANFNNIGSVYYKLGQYTKALEVYEQALAMHKQIGDRTGVDTDFNNIGVIYYILGQYTKALEFFEQGLAMNKGMGDLREALTLYQIGSVYYKLGQYTKALEFLEQSLAIRQKVGDRIGEGDSFNALGLVYSDLGQRTKAVKSYRQGLTVYRQINDKAGEATTLMNVRGAHLFLSEYLKVLKSYQRALDIYKKIDNQAGQGETLYKIGFVYKKLAQDAKALEFYTQALAIFKQTGLKAEEGKTLNYIGDIYFDQNQYAKALEFYTQALAIFKQTGLKWAEGTILTNIGFIYNNLGQYPKAEKTLFAAIEVRESLRPRLKDDQKISILETQAVSYRLLQKALVAQNKNTTALEIAERGRARAFVELLASKLSPNPNIKQLKPPNIKQIQQIAQQQKATLVEYSIIYPFQVQSKEERHPQLYIWVVKPTGEVIFKQVNLKSLDKPLADLITKSRTSIRARSGDAVAIPGEASANPHQKKPLQQLYQILIQPIASNLPQDPNSRVIFIPQAELFFVPFPALQDEFGKYLIEKHTILTAPAIQVLQLTHQQKINKRKAIKNRTALVVGNPTMPQQLSPLAGAEQEALRIAKILNTQALTGSKATETTVKQLMQSVDVVHLATHGLLHDFKGLGVPGAIALAPSSQDDGLLRSGEIFDMKLDADLVVLSACDTGRGDIKNDDVIGLSRSLISAGAPSVIVSLWTVADDSTTLLMTEFYQNLRRNPDKAVALRNAMLSTMKQYRHPIEWAAFTLIGEAE
ncbi:MAG: CHAT domain-containing protein [Nostoc sp. DedQUE04]|uniref:CHAT domain-containing protein n=1 Tax=Nostoc sp. DedQUE04 TaxID=3075390 RepID=UPI002AD4274F|nr:CHAT domain-containing protein [Nostoc sp. DedQUE04]MDZ8140747.1 CHAT domain-containing protein [Nostoc sp. DedQUE04]